jgi:hypothetical protein
VVLAAPDAVDYDEVSNTVSWRDNASGEEGYRITVDLSGEIRVFEVGPNVEALQLPPDFRLSCPENPSIAIEVRAFLGASESEFAFFGISGLCPPGTVTPVPTGFPDAGSGGGGPADDKWTLPVALLVGGASALAFVLILPVLRRLRR